MGTFRLSFRLDGLCQQLTGAYSYARNIDHYRVGKCLPDDGNCLLDLFPCTTPSISLTSSLSNTQVYLK
jgi:hypothetical protein